MASSTSCEMLSSEIVDFPLPNELSNLIFSFLFVGIKNKKVYEKLASPFRLVCKSFLYRTWMFSSSERVIDINSMVRMIFFLFDRLLLNLYI